MGKLFEHASKRETLDRAWRRIHANGRTSKAQETRVAIEQFGRTAPREIHRIQERLRKGTFEFDPQKGVAKPKGSGGKRGIVMASVHNRVVERALLDTLQEKSAFIKDVITMPTSVGGVPERSVPHGLKLIHEAIKNGFNHFIRSDISGFFDHVPRKAVIDRIKNNLDDMRFIKVLNEATTVTLGNEAALGEDRAIFPTNDEGVAQGSPLSPLFGNILLYDFDNKFNNDGLICIRFIDDFILLAKSEREVTSAFHDAKAFLAALGMSCHDPFSKSSNSDKADRGKIEDGFVFLGYHILPGIIQPSASARKSIKETVNNHLSTGRQSISAVLKADNSFERHQRYAQTLVMVDLVLKGWGQAFAYGNAPYVLGDLDKAIDESIANFRKWYARKMEQADWKTRRRTGGICLLSDIPPKTFDDVPIILEKGKRFVTTSRTITVSTDGSVITQGRRLGRDRGSGGWAFLIHETGEEKYGSAPNVTNNQMELQAVIEALRQAPPSPSIKIRTDSQYVYDAIEKGSSIKKNQKMWGEYKKALADRSIKVIWVKGHSGDVQNERVDSLANLAAQRQRKTDETS